MRYSNLFSKIAVGAVAGLMFTATATNATIWDIVQVQSGTSGGFGFSGFHDATGNVMSGVDLGAISNGPGAVFGSFNDATGVFAATLKVDISSVISVFTLASTGTNLNFGGGSGFLTGPATLDIDFGGSPITLGDNSSTLTTTILGFKSGDVCCSGGSTDPNSFNIAGDGLSAILTLWGANGFNVSSQGYSGSTLGMDLRLGLSKDPNQGVGVVPLPAALPLYGTGLAIMGFVGWRRKRKAAA